MLLKIEHSKKLSESVTDFQRFVINSFNNQWETNLKVVEVELTDTRRSEVKDQNFIYIRTITTDGKQELTWTSKLIPEEYSSDIISLLYLPLIHPKIRLEPGNVFYSNGKIDWCSFIPFFDGLEAPWAVQQSVINEEDNQQ